MVTSLGNWNCLIEAKSRYYTFAYKKRWKCHNRFFSHFNLSLPDRFVTHSDPQKYSEHS